jgi:beta-glucosidase
VKFQVSSNARLFLGGQKIFDDWTQTVDAADPVNLKFFPTIVVRKVHLQVGQPLAVTLEYKFPTTLDYIVRFIGAPRPEVGLGWAPLEAPADLKTYDAVVIAAGFDQNYEGEDADRGAVTDTEPGSFELPELQDELIQKLAAANPHTLVVLHGGGSMDVQKWIGQVQGLVHVVFPGQDGGRALAEILFGEVNPSGKLPFTFEKRFEDNPAYPNYPADLSADPAGNTATYKEGIFVGYRGFDKNHVEPQYPFGYGLSYTTFRYSDLSVAPAALFPDFKARVSFTISNTGRRAGAEVAQLYVGKADSKVERPIRELKGFQKVYIGRGESRRVTLELGLRDLAYWDATTHDWAIEPGTYQLWVGGSSRDLPLQGTLSNFDAR